MKIRPDAFLRQIDEYQRQYPKEKTAWRKENRSAIKNLRVKLLKIGGTRISPQPHPDIRFIVDHGRPHDYPVIFKEMEPSSCHGNVFELWVNRTKRSRLVAICTGYALTDHDDGMWCPHSWALRKTKGVVSIIETTVSRTKYFVLRIRLIPITIRSGRCSPGNNGPKSPTFCKNQAG
jgi:hypothetical protein